MSSFNIVKPLEDKSATKYHIEGWNGPFKGKFCHKYAAGSKRGVGLFATFLQALDAAEECDECLGITYQPGKGVSDEEEDSEDEDMDEMIASFDRAMKRAEESDIESDDEE